MPPDGHEDERALDAARKVLRLLVAEVVLAVGPACAYVSTPRATSAATMLTTASTASESRPTEPVRKYAANLRMIVTIEVASESHA